MEEMIKLLVEQNQLLRELLAAQNKPTLGWSERSASSQWIFVGRNKDSCLYKLDAQNEQIPMKESTFAGYIVDASIKRVTRRGKETDKLIINLRTDDATYTLCGGYDTHFAESFLASIAAMDANALLLPVRLVFVPGDDENIVWTRIYAPDYIKVTRAEGDDFEAIAQKALAKLSPKPASAPAPATVAPLFPQHANFIAKLCVITGHSTEWIHAQCQAHGGDCPERLAPEALRKLVKDIACDYGHRVSVANPGATYQRKIDSFEAAGKRWGEGVLAWFKEIQTLAAS